MVGYNTNRWTDLLPEALLLLQLRAKVNDEWQIASEKAHKTAWVFDLLFLYGFK
jgi:hypothetical protein